MADQPLAEMVEIAVREFTSEADAAIQQSSQIAEHDDSNPTGKRRRVEVELQESEEGEDSIQTLLYSASKTLCLRLDAIEANLNSMEDKCKCLRAKVDMLANQNAFRPPLAEHTATEGQRQTGSSLQKKPRGCPGDSAEDRPVPKEEAVCRERRPSQEPAEGQMEPSEGPPGILGPGVRIVALCAESRGDGEERADGGVALLPDATNLLYQLMY